MIVVWLRRDLRLADNPALADAAARGAIVPVFVLDPRLRGRSERRDAWFAATLAALDRQLRLHGARLVIRRGDPIGELVQVAREVGATGVWWNRDATPYARQRDATAESAFRAAALEPRSFADATLSEPSSVVPARGGFYTIFTPFFRAWLGGVRLPPAPAPPRIRMPGNVRTLPPPEPTVDALPSAGERSARAAVTRFVDGALGTYAARRDRLDDDPTSRLSPYLRVGALSPRQVYAEVVAAAARDRRVVSSADAFIRQLAWRDFFVQILWHAPATRWKPLRPPRAALRWRGDAGALAAWQAGRTGYPVVDAAMRQLAATGFIANRARMIAASFLVKHLLVDWRDGDRWFMCQLLDGDPALNGGNWQWVASVGADALPAFRIFNPVTQGRRFDPTGTYVRRWVPELASAGPIDVHAPWETGGVAAYPPPIVEHAAARRRALAAFGAGLSALSR